MTRGVSTMWDVGPTTHAMMDDGELSYTASDSWDCRNDGRGLRAPGVCGAAGGAASMGSRALAVDGPNASASVVPVDGNTAVAGVADDDDDDVVAVPAVAGSALSVAALLPPAVSTTVKDLRTGMTGGTAPMRVTSDVLRASKENSRRLYSARDSVASLCSVNGDDGPLRRAELHSQVNAGIQGERHRSSTNTYSAHIEAHTIRGVIRARAHVSGNMQVVVASKGKQAAKITVECEAT